MFDTHRRTCREALSCRSLPVARQPKKLFMTLRYNIRSFFLFFFFKEGGRGGEEGRSYVTGTFFLQRHDDFARMEDLELIYCGKDFYP